MADVVVRDKNKSKATVISLARVNVIVIKTGSDWIIGFEVGLAVQGVLDFCNK